MELIDYRVLNCYLNSLVSIAAHLGVDYVRTFSTLWSETVFSFDTKSRVFFTVRLEDGLASQGLRTTKLACAEKGEAAESIRKLPAGGFAVFGMDMCDVPWSPFYKQFGGPHYFAARNDGGFFTCYDPTYGKSGLTLTYAHMTAHAYDIRRAELSAPAAAGSDLFAEAENVLAALPALQAKLLAGVDEAAGEGRRKALLTARYTDALINNRYLYKRYLSDASPDAERHFDKSYFSRWEGVKNGLFKAAVLKNNAEALDGVRALFCGVIGAEREIAQKILSEAKGSSE